jgi:hypothetical protein
MRSFSQNGRTAGHVVHMVSKRNECEVLVGICEGKRPFSIKYIVIDGGMIVKRVISKQDGCVLCYCGARWGPLVGCCERRASV